jgi:hypothetical protein
MNINLITVVFIQLSQVMSDKIIDYDQNSNDLLDKNGEEVSIRKFMIQKILEEPEENRETNIMESEIKVGEGIELFHWEWNKDLLRTLWMFGLFFLIASLIKIGYHQSPFLTTTIPESWFVYSLEFKSFAFNIIVN